VSIAVNIKAFRCNFFNILCLVKDFAFADQFSTCENVVALGSSKIFDVPNNMYKTLFDILLYTFIS